MEPSLQPSSEKHRLLLGRILIGFLLFSATFGVIFSYNVHLGNNGFFKYIPFLSTWGQLTGTSDETLRGETDDRINILLMGIGGEGHDGPQLTDTMMLVSYKPSTNEVGMLSIPRDLGVEIPGYGLQKMNHANAYAEAKEAGSGPFFASQVLSTVLNQPIHYYLKVDFSGFDQLIDSVGGIDVDVETAFVDKEYPIEGKEMEDCGTTIDITAEDGTVTTVPTYGCRYEVLTFTKGPVHLDGKTALKYVRSRHGNNGEGSDFARSRRQRQVILALKSKFLQAGTYLSPSTISQVQTMLDKHVATNIQTWEAVRLGKKLLNFDPSTIRHEVLDDGPASPLYATSASGSYLLLPKKNDWGPVQQMVADLFSAPLPASPQPVVTKVAPAPVPPPAPSPVSKPVAKPSVEIQNGTFTVGLASRTAELLSKDVFTVASIGNAPMRDYTETIIYDYTNGRFSKERETLQSLLHATIKSPPSSPSPDTKIDFLVVLGENAVTLPTN